MSLMELLVISVIILFVIKPEDIPVLFRGIKKIRKYLNDVIKDIYKLMGEKDESKKIDDDDDLMDLNRYLKTIIEIQGYYNGKYNVEDIENCYKKLLKNQQKIER